MKTLIVTILMAITFFCLGVIFTPKLTPKQPTVPEPTNTTNEITELKKELEDARSLLTLNQSYTSNNNRYNLIDSCSKKGCVFTGPEAVEGFGYFKGYYKTRKTLDYWGDVPVTCDTFVVTEGNTELVKDLKSWVDKGNSINTINEKNQLVVNISFEGLNKAEESAIKNATEKNPVQLGVIRVTPVGRGVPACTSIVDIVNVK